MQFYLHPPIAIITLKITSIISISVLYCRTNQCPSDSLRLCECAGILRNQSHPGALEGISGFPREKRLAIPAPFLWLSSSAPISHFKYRAASSKSSMPECRVESLVQSYISLCTGGWKAVITSLSSWWVMGSHKAEWIPRMAEAPVVPGAGCSCENPVDVVGCLALGRIVAICSTGVVSHTVCRSSPVPQKCWGLEQPRGVRAFKGISLG